MQKQYQAVHIGRLPDDEDGNYEVLALPPGAGFRDPENYDRFTASWLKLNGYGFACSGAELSEYDRLVTIEQDHEGGSLHIRTEADA